MSITSAIQQIKSELPSTVQLVAVSKFKPASDILEAYRAGQRAFGENRPQELAAKAAELPADIQWHFIGHLQTNKVKQIVPFVHLIHSVDSEHLLECINREAEKAGRKVNVLLELHVAKEESKTGFTPDELDKLAETMASDSPYPFVSVKGVMGMATNTDNEDEWRRCFRLIAAAAHRIENTLAGNAAKPMIISMGMSEDYPVAIEEGSTMVRIGSSIFGARDYSKPFTI